MYLRQRVLAGLVLPRDVGCCCLQMMVIVFCSQADWQMVWQLSKTLLWYWNISLTVGQLARKLGPPHSRSKFSLIPLCCIIALSPAKPMATTFCMDAIQRILNTHTLGPVTLTQLYHIFTGNATVRWPDHLFYYLLLLLWCHRQNSKMKFMRLKCSLCHWSFSLC